MAGILDNMKKMIRERRMTEVLGCVIVLRGGDITPNLLGRKAAQWSNLCCDFGGPFNVIMHVGERWDTKGRENRKRHPSSSDSSKGQRPREGKQA